MKFPTYLKPGDTIAIVCPAGYLPAAKAKACINTLKKWGFKVTKGKTLGGKSKNYFSGSFEERLADLQNQIDDPSINAILCGRGGYGTNSRKIPSGSLVLATSPFCILICLQKLVLQVYTDQWQMHLMKITASTDIHCR